MKTIIMAHGKASRWKRTDCDDELLRKHFLLLDNRTIIERTIDQIRKYDTNSDIILFAPQDFKPYVDSSITLFSPESYSDETMIPSLISGILMTTEFWHVYGTVIILGDVVFSNFAIQNIYSPLSVDEVTFYGRPHKNLVTGKEAAELFGLRFSGMGLYRVMHECMMLSRLSDSGKVMRLWNLYAKHYLGTEVETRSDLSKVYDFNDYTDDCDSLEEYLFFWYKLQQAALRDDESKTI